MKDNENYLGKAGAYLQGMDEVGKPSRASEPRLANIVGLAQAEQTGRLADSMARIADAMEVANRLKEAELSASGIPIFDRLDEPQQEHSLPADSPAVARPWDRAPSVTDIPPAGDLG